MPKMTPTPIGNIVEAKALLAKTDVHYIVANSLWAIDGPVYVRVYKSSLLDAIRDVLERGRKVQADVAPANEFVNWYCLNKREAP